MKRRSQSQVKDSTPSEVSEVSEAEVEVATPVVEAEEPQVVEEVAQAEVAEEVAVGPVKEEVKVEVVKEVAKEEPKATEVVAEVIPGIESTYLKIKDVIQEALPGIKVELDLQRQLIRVIGNHVYCYSRLFKNRNTIEAEYLSVTPSHIISALKGIYKQNGILDRGRLFISKTGY